MQEANGVKKVSNPRGARERRERAKERLEAQLKAGTKWGLHYEGDKLVRQDFPLTKEDIFRIKKEIDTLKSRI